jgi:hypothetical protein
MQLICVTTVETLDPKPGILPMTMLGVVRLSSQRSVITEAVMTGCRDDVLCRVDRTQFDDGSTFVSLLQSEVLNVPIALNRRFTQSVFRMSGFKMGCAASIQVSSYCYKQTAS